MLKFDDLDTDEQRNEILKAIHNRLSEISICLEYAVRHSDTMNNFETNGIALNKFQTMYSAFIQPSPGMYIENQNEENN